MVEILFTVTLIKSWNSHDFFLNIAIICSNMIQFYKPNPRNSGSACSFYKTRDGAIMFSIIKQASWDDSKKTGSFQKNRQIQGET